MLQLRPNCEAATWISRRSPARISFECTFGAKCVDSALQGKCPNCGGELVRRYLGRQADAFKRPRQRKWRLGPSDAPPSLRPS